MHRQTINVWQLNKDGDRTILICFQYRIISDEWMNFNRFSLSLFKLILINFDILDGFLNHFYIKLVEHSCRLIGIFFFLDFHFEHNVLYWWINFLSLSGLLEAIIFRYLYPLRHIFPASKNLTCNLWSFEPDLKTIFYF